MLKFREMTLADRDWIQAALQKSNFMGCEYSFANNLAWCRMANTQVCAYDGFYLLCSMDTPDGTPHFTFPAGDGNLRGVVAEMAEFAATREKPLVIGGLTERNLPQFQALFPNGFTYASNRDDADYLYRTADFAAMAGKKFHKKRNHIAQFSKYGAVFSEMTPHDFEECIAFAAQSYNAKEGYADRSSVMEQYAIHTFFSHFEELELKGGLLRVDGALAAFSIGEPICDNVFGVHIEKADTQYHGAYPAMAQQFAQHFAMDYEYLNREEDLGVEGLRKSKLSYYPEIILEKWTATCENPKRLF